MRIPNTHVYWYQCPRCGEERRLINVPEIHKDAAAPLCELHRDLVQMVRVGK